MFPVKGGIFRVIHHFAFPFVLYSFLYVPPIVIPVLERGHQRVLFKHTESTREKAISFVSLEVSFEMIPHERCCFAGGKALTKAFDQTASRRLKKDLFNN
jgi:hypothetical protein